VRELPEGWAICRFEAISSPDRHSIKRGPFGSTLKKDFFVSQGYKVYEQKNAIYDDCKLGNYYIDQNKFAELIDFSVQPGDFIISCSGTIGRVSCLPEYAKPGVINQALLKISFDSQLVYRRYISYFLESNDFQKILTGNSRGSAMQNISSVKELRGAEIPLPPLNEQKRIADRLDQLLTRIGKTKAHLDRLPPLLKRFRQSVLAAATSGKLTEDWREERSLDIRNWKDIAIGQLIDRIEAGINVQCEERPPLAHEYGLVKISAVTWGIYDDSKSKTIPVTHTVPESTRITVGDFLISRANTLELVAACVIVEKVERPVFLSDKVLRVVMNEEHKKWLLFWLRSENGRQQIESLASGNQLSMRNITQASIKSITLQLPTIAEQQEIVRRVEALFAKADRIEAQYKNARQQVDRFTPALLAKAFRGELVPQDPNDEPASVLLERVKEAKSIPIVGGNANGKPSKKGRVKKEKISKL
jgi:type I restriction enzyme, S subunit